MRYKLSALLALSMAWTGAASASEFCDGFKDGYTGAYQSAAGVAVSVIVPVCPVNPGRSFGGAGADYYNGALIGGRQASSDYRLYRYSVSTPYGNIARTWDERGYPAGVIRNAVTYPSYTLRNRR
ncbi:MAG: hypothetical protein IT365_17535 [Candidatus Hydrogenedentes bacterium]|nr:hypothetical protein [Candidatus Hydrogenedentota bacterium]